MSVEVQAPAHDVPTTSNYYTPIGEEPPFQYVQAPPEGVPKHNIGNEPHPAVVHDVRGSEDKYDIGLDKSGFQFVKHESSEKDFLDEERIAKEYYKEVEELLKKELGVKRVVIFDHTIRRNYEEAEGKHDVPGTSGDLMNRSRQRRHLIVL